jgi:hypothetical protein
MTSQRMLESPLPWAHKIRAGALGILTESMSFTFHMGSIKTPTKRCKIGKSLSSQVV